MRVVLTRPRAFTLMERPETPAQTVKVALLEAAAL
jgi:hypothetical protein